MIRSSPFHLSIAILPLPIAFCVPNLPGPEPGYHEASRNSSANGPLFVACHTHFNAGSCKRPTKSPRPSSFPRHTRCCTGLPTEKEEKRQTQYSVLLLAWAMIQLPYAGTAAADWPTTSSGYTTPAVETLAAIRSCNEVIRLGANISSLGRVLYSKYAWVDRRKYACRADSAAR